MSFSTGCEREDRTSVPSEGVISDINAEVDLEIALREQLSKTLEARIAWGLLLQKSITNGRGTNPPESFRNVALDTLSTLELSSKFILASDPTPPPNAAAQAARPSPRKSYYPISKPKTSFLYTRSNPAARQDIGSYNSLYILKCPVCLRTTFTSLQGLLNHARLTHSLEWGTHDECIRACAVLDNVIDVDAGTEVAIGPLGVLPGLQTIFQNAVGAQSREPVDPSGEQHDADVNDKGEPVTEGDYLNQTLGLHKDSPALAPFLGKEVVRRQIRVWEEDVDIDFNASQDANSMKTIKGKSHWKMAFSHRNFEEIPVLVSETTIEQPYISASAERMVEESDLTRLSTSPVTKERIISNQSRFCFIARIIITDRSISVTKDQMPDELKGYTHKWMVSVDAPAYAHHITRVLNAVKVCPADPTIMIPMPPPTTEPPFVVVGVSDRPFLAKVELSFSGTSSEETRLDQKVIFEHWVDLDPIGDRNVVVGQDQVLDVELDKNTVLKPLRLGYTPIDSKANWNRVPIGSSDQGQVAIQDPSLVENSSLTPEVILNKLTRRFPMTQGRWSQACVVPYRLVPTPAYYRTLVVGRRKAIEFGRARAIQEAYNTKVQSLQNPNIRPMSVAEVHAWLLQNNHFIQVKDDAEEPVIKQETTGPIIKEVSELSSHWCRICGLDISRHAAMSSVKAEHFDCNETKMGSQTMLSILTSDDTCPVVPRMLQIAKLPKIDIEQLMTGDNAELYNLSTYSLAGSPQSLVHAADPRLTLHIRRLVENLGLSKFRPVLKTTAENARPIYPLDESGDHRLDTQKNLAPYALLALVTKSFIRTLVERGLEIAKRDSIISAGFSSSKPQKGNRRATENNLTQSRMLTPTHILSGILARGRSRGSSQNPLDTAVLLCLSKLGVAADLDPLETRSQGQLLPRVKLEEQ